MKEYEIEKSTLDGLTMADKQLDKDRNNGCDWKNDQEKALYLAEQHAKERCKRLDRLVPNRICPMCKRKVWMDRMWVITKSSQAFCRSCYYSRVNNDKDVVVVGGFLGEVLVRFEIDGWKLRAMRIKSGVGATAFADRMGWSRTYLYRLEGGYIKSLDKEIVERMIDVFDSFGIVVVESVI